VTTRDELLALIQAHHLDEPRYRWRMRLAELAGVSIHAVDSWCDGRCNPSRQTIMLLAERLKGR